MLDYGDVGKLVEKVAKPALGRENVVRVFTEPGGDAEGMDGLRITIVMTPEAVEKIDGDTLLDNVLNVHEALERHGEERTPMIGYATGDELAEIGDTES